MQEPTSLLIEPLYLLVITLIHLHMAQDCNCTKGDDTIGAYVLRTLRVAARA
jgi:hypothetical protein